MLSHTELRQTRDVLARVPLPLEMLVHSLRQVAVRQQHWAVPHFQDECPFCNIEHHIHKPFSRKAHKLVTILTRQS